MSEIKTLELLLPDWMASALINGDFSSFSLDDDDGEEAKKQIESVHEYVTAQGYRADPVDVSEGDFYNRPPIDAVSAYGETKGGTFCTYTFIK